MNKLRLRKKSILPFINKKKQIKLNGDTNIIINNELQEVGGQLFDTNGDLIINNKIENVQKESSKPAHISYAVDATVDTIVDFPFTETYERDFKENRRENKKLTRYEQT